MNDKYKKIVEIGAKWLLSHSPTKGDIYCLSCGIVATELTSYAGEQADVLGFANDDKTVLLEAKTSRADFLKDQKKYFRINPELGMGDFRMYIAPVGLLKVDEIPDKWGFIEVAENDKCKVIKYAEKQKSNKMGEHIVLKSIIKRIGQNAPEGISIKCYTRKTKNNAGLWLEQECNNDRG